MAKTILENLCYKPIYTFLFYAMPPDVEDFFPLTSNTIDKTIPYDFVVFFAKTKADLKQLKELQKPTILWVAYPKAKTLNTDLNCDILHNEMKAYGYDGVSLVSIDNTWSIMRLK